MAATIEIVSNVRAVVRGASDEALDRLDEAFSFEVKGHQFSPKFKAKIWDGKRHLFSTTTGTFPLGLLPRVRKLLPKFKVVDRRPSATWIASPDAVRPDLLKGVELRDYQVDATRALLAKQGGIVQAATNAGKTAILSAVLKLHPKQTALVLVHTKVLMKQSVRAIASFLGIVEDAIGVIGDGIYRPARITVGIVNSVVKRARADRKFREWLRSRDIYAGDEVHHNRSKTFFFGAQMCEARLRIGLSATPGQTPEDRLLVEATVGPVVARVTNNQLIKLGVSARPTVEIVDYESSAIERGWEWFDVYKKGLVMNEGRNAAIVRHAELHAKQGRKVLVLVAQTWHGEILESMLRVLDVAVDFAHAKVRGGVDEIEEKKERFEREIGGRVLIGTPVFGEGVDIPAIEVLVIADGQKSLRKILQQVGRALRKKKKGENVVTIVDFADFAHPLLAAHSAERIKTYEREQFEVVPL